MKYNLYSVKDVRVGFDGPQLAINDGAALRNFADMVANDKSYISKHPEDYQLFKIGEIELNTGDITPEVKFLANAIDFTAKN